MRKTFLLTITLAALAGLIFAVSWFQQPIIRLFFLPTKTKIQRGIQNPESTTDIKVVAQNLTIPWQIGFPSEGELLVTERPGRLLRVGEDLSIMALDRPIHVGEGGLLGLTLHPRFADNGWIYLYMTIESDGGLKNRVERYHLNHERLEDPKIIVDDIPGAWFHNGGFVTFGPDGHLYVTTGDATDPYNAQDTNSLAGKILRFTDEGEIPEDNPFGNEVFTYGHRNVQGLTWDDNGRMWATEHGPSGWESGIDEINRIEKGKNYGWPLVRGDEVRQDMENPYTHSGPYDTWAPAAIAYWDGSLFFAGLRGEALYELPILDPEGKTMLMHFKSVFGRIRAVCIGPDGFMYISTSNRDGRGSVRPGDDKIIRINPEIFRKN